MEAGDMVGFMRISRAYGTEAYVLARAAVRREADPANSDLVTVTLSVEARETALNTVPPEHFHGVGMPTAQIHVKNVPLADAAALAGRAYDERRKNGAFRLFGRLFKPGLSILEYDSVRFGREHDGRLEVTWTAQLPDTWLHNGEDVMSSFTVEAWCEVDGVFGPPAT
jgi:hypothetical protein